jgi:putative endonuclease
MYIGQVSGNMTGSVYILRCANGRYYIGSSLDPMRRLDEHRAGSVSATRNVQPVELVFAQSFETIALARQIEYRLKKKKSRVIVEKIIQDGTMRFAGKSLGR